MLVEKEKKEEEFEILLNYQDQIKKEEREFV